MKKVLVILMVALIILSGCGAPKNDTVPTNDVNDSETNDKVEDNATETRDIVLYFANSQAQFVVPEHRTVEVEKDIDTADFAKIVLKELIKGPEEENLYKTIPSEVKVLNVELQEGTLLIDFSKEMYTKHWRGAAGEDMTISSLTNTMTELEGVKNVLPSVEGTALNIEHIVVEEPLERMEDKIYR